MASTACRRPVASPAEQLPEPPRLTLTPGQIARDLEEVCALGFVEKFKDQFNVTRYRPTNGRIV